MSVSEQAGTDFEALLRRALAPVEPPEELAARLERRSTTLTELAAEELEAWELVAMRDPRNWVRPVAAAAAIGTAAGAALVVLRVRASQKRRHAQGRSPARARRAHAARRRRRGPARPARLSAGAPAADPRAPSAAADHARTRP